MVLVEQLHIIQAHLLHYAALLQDFRKSIVFVQKTSHPALSNTPNEAESKRLMDKECKTLLAEIERLDRAREVQINRLKNVMSLASRSRLRAPFASLTSFVSYW
jgi:CRISPR/Cas system-associated endonuclease Cas1